MGSDKFCLKWNDFETNISTAFRELREDSDFFDCTLMSCDDEQINAHKVILSACSPLFRNILRKNPSREPVLWMKDLKMRDLQAVMAFMYNGEVNVAQDELNSFLSVAEELKVKGLTQNHQSQSTAVERRNVDQEVQQRKKEVVQVAPVKQELEQASGQMVHHGEEQAAAEYQDQEREEEYGVVFEDYRNYDGEFPANDTAEVKGSFGELIVKLGSSEIQCSLCNAIFARKDNARRHLKLVHFGEEGKTWPCDICHHSYKNQISLDNHRRTAHSVYKSTAS